MTVAIDEPASPRAGGFFEAAPLRGACLRREYLNANDGIDTKNGVRGERPITTNNNGASMSKHSSQSFKNAAGLCKVLGVGAAASAISFVPVVSWLGITGNEGAALISVIATAAAAIPLNNLMDFPERPKQASAAPNYDDYKK